MLLSIYLLSGRAARLWNAAAVSCCVEWVCIYRTMRPGMGSAVARAAIGTCRIVLPFAFAFAFLLTLSEVCR